MTVAANKAAARSYFEQVLNRGEVSAADAIFAPDIQFHYPLGELSGADMVKGYVSAFLTAFPDAHFTVADLIGEGNRVAARWSLVGSQTGEFGSNAPTGKKVSFPGNTVFSFVDGKVQEVWITFDPAQLVND
jgi:predicted ester cyclase